MKQVPRIVLVLDLARWQLGLAAAEDPQTAVQLRDRTASARELLAALSRLVAAGVNTLVNDRADLCLAAGAAGVHLPEAGLAVADARRLLGPDLLIGVSTHVGTPLVERSAGADYTLFGPVFQTPEKGQGVGTDALARAVRDTPCPVLAIGGIDRNSASAALATGAYGVAVLRAADDLTAVKRVFS